MGRINTNFKRAVTLVEETVRRGKEASVVTVILLFLLKGKVVKCKHLLCIDSTYKNVKCERTFSRVQRNIHFSTLSYI